MLCVHNAYSDRYAYTSRVLLHIYIHNYVCTCTLRTTLVHSRIHICTMVHCYTCIGLVCTCTSHVHSLFPRFREYPDLVSEYNYNKYGQSSSHDLSCDTQCIRDTICTVSTIISLERIKCINDSE